MTQGEIEALSKTIEKLSAELELDIMKDIVRRMKANDNLMTSSAAYQIERLQQMGRTDDYIKARLQEYLKVSEAEINKIYVVETQRQYEKFEVLFKKTGNVFVPYSKNAEMQVIINAMLTQTKNTFRNFADTAAFSTIVNGKTITTALAEYYWDVLDNALMGITTGAFDYNTALRKAVTKMTRSGLRTVDYASGRSYRIESAARMALMTGYSQINQEMNSQIADALGINTFEVSYHIGARPSHQEWQGRVYTHEELVNTCELGQVTGLCGANCYHWYNPFIEGVSVRNYTDDQLKNMLEEENRSRTYDGKEYTTYTGLQQQRKLELIMRTVREEIALLTEGDGADFDILAAKIKYRQTLQEYTKFSESVGLPEQKERIYMDGLGKVA
ncbi:MAG: phage minor capsid protein [Lachnospiraceae bacterium]